MASPADWELGSWRTKPIKQQPSYPDVPKLQSALDEVRRLPPLVTPSEVDALRRGLAEVAAGKRFLLQGGDCAERFMDCADEPIEKKLKILLQMSLVLTWGARIPTLRIARMAGQFSKPRTKETEVVNGVEMAAFRGDNINSFDTSARTPDPARLVAGYFHSAATLNYARALLAGGLADLHSASHWDLGFVQDEAHRDQYAEMVQRILSALDFMRVCGVESEAALKTADIYMSHEGLQLAYEEALTRPVRKPHTRSGHAFRTRAPSAQSSGAAASGAETPVHPPAAHPHPSAASAHSAAAPASAPAPAPAPAAAFVADPHTSGTTAPAHDPEASYYNLGTHFLWIGDRTRQLDHAHVEYCRGIANPVGIKVGPTSDPAEMVALIRRLWPDPAAAPGKVVLITRLGAANVRAKLPIFIKAIQAARLSAQPVWVCDPMHGNTRLSSNGFKTREFDDILAELKHTFEVHRELGSRLGGCHFELTGENVTECTGGPEKLLEGDLPLRYTTYCDPRLNYAQGMELAFLIAQYLADEREEQLAADTGVPLEAFIDADGHGGFDPRVLASSSASASAGGSHAHGSAGAAAASSSGELSGDASTHLRLAHAIAAVGGDAGGSSGSGSGGIPRVSSKARFAAGRGLSPPLSRTSGSTSPRPSAFAAGPSVPQLPPLDAAGPEGATASS